MGREIDMGLSGAKEIMSTSSAVCAMHESQKVTCNLFFI